MVPFPTPRLRELGPRTVGRARAHLCLLRRPLRLLSGIRAGCALARDRGPGHFRFDGAYAAGSLVHARHRHRLAFPRERSHLLDLQVRLRVLRRLLGRHPLVLRGRSRVRRERGNEGNARLLAAEFSSARGAAIMTRNIGCRQRRKARRVLHDLLQGAEARERG